MTGAQDLTFIPVIVSPCGGVLLWTAALRQSPVPRALGSQTSQPTRFADSKMVSLAIVRGSDVDLEFVVLQSCESILSIRR